MVRRLNRLSPGLNDKGRPFQRLIQKVGELVEADMESLNGIIDTLLADNNTWTGSNDFQGSVQCDSFRIDQAPTVETLVCTHSITINVNGTAYKIPIRVA